VQPGSPAEAAGLKRGDAIRRFNGQPVRDMVFLRSRVAEVEINGKVELTIVRNGQEQTLTVQIVEAPTVLNPKATPAPH
jgi:serine protease Do